MTNYPIIFSLGDPVMGRGFLATVHIDGRALMQEEDEGFWIDGVFPGAVCAGGVTRNEALLKFRDEYRAVLYDIAATASSFEEFEAEVERFFWEETPGEAEAWQEAVEALRANPKQAGDWLPVRTRYSEPSIKVVCLSEAEIEPASNPVEEVELMVPAA